MPVTLPPGRAKLGRHHAPLCVGQIGLVIESVEGNQINRRTKKTNVLGVEVEAR